MQSTANYLWHTDDLLGQGATASVYKARNKVIALELARHWTLGVYEAVHEAPELCSVYPNEKGLG